jgi:hypothetical protein
MLNPDVPVSYAVIVTVGGNFTCAIAIDAVTAVALRATATSFMIGLTMASSPLGLTLQP